MCSNNFAPDCSGAKVKCVLDISLLQKKILFLFFYLNILLAKSAIREKELIKRAHFKILLGIKVHFKSLPST